MRVWQMILCLLVLIACGKDPDEKGPKEGKLDNPQELVDNVDRDADLARALYEEHCAECHGGLEVSTKRGRKFEDIKMAIEWLPQMNSLEDLLSDEELLKIAQALQD